MLALIDLAYATASLVALLGAVEQARLDHRVEASQGVAPGASQSDVLAALGAPSAAWDINGGFLSPASPTWAYGTTIDLGGIIGYSTYLPDPLSFKLRLFGPYESDLVVTWDAEQRVESVTRP